MKAIWLVGVMAMAATPAAAQLDEMRAGVLAHDLGPLSTNKEDGVALNAEAVFEPLSGLSWLGSPRPIIGVAIATDGEATSQAYLGLAWRIAIARRYFAEFGGGLTVHDGETDFDPAEPLLRDTAYLGCRALARLSVEAGYRVTERVSASLHVTHASNAGLCDENEGLDSTGLRIGYRF